MPKILLTNHHLSDYAGSELVTLDLATEFQQRGWDVTVATFRLGGEIETKFQERSIQVVNVLNESLVQLEFDLVWGHHYPVLVKCLIDDSVKTKHLVISSLSPYEPLEAIPFFDDQANLILCNSEETKAEIIKDKNFSDVEAAKLFVFKNSVPSDWFDLSLSRNSSTLKKLAIISNHSPQENSAIIDLLKSKKVDADLIGSYGSSKLVDIDLLTLYDAVITIGRTTQHCMALEIPVFCYDRFGGPGWITPANLELAEWFNYSGRCCHQKLSTDQIVNRLIDEFVEAKRHTAFLKSYAFNHYSLSKNIDTVLNSIGIFSQQEKEYFNFSTEKTIQKVGKLYQRLLNSQEILQNQLDRSQSQFQQSQSEFQQSQSRLDESQFQLQQKQFELEQAYSKIEQSQSQLHQVQKYFEDAINEISSMETSKFWKLRQIWFKLKRLISLSRQTLSSEGVLPLSIKVKKKIAKKLRSGTENSTSVNSINLQLTNLELPRKIGLNTSENPSVSIIIPVFNQSNYTFNCLNSLSSIQSIEYEIIVIDDASTDDTQKVLGDISGIKIVTNSENLGFIRSCNRGAAEAKGEFICFLNNDTKVFPNWMESLLEVIKNDPTVGAVGSKLIYPDGRLQEAGGIIWQDASGCNFGRLDDPLKPEYNYVREVDYCSGASLLVRNELLKQIGGFSEEFLPAYYEDTDFCFTVRSLGSKVMYQPKSQVIHFEGISSGTDINSGVKKHQQTNAIKFEIKWRETLQKHLSANEQDRDGARRYSPKPTILIIDSYVPLYDKESGSYRIYNIIKIFKNLGYSIIFLPDNGLGQEPYASELQAMGVEVLYSTNEMPEMKSHLLARLSLIDIAWICRPELCEKYLGLFKQYPKIRLIYDTIDLHFLRVKREKELLGDAIIQKVSWQQVQNQELSLAKSVQSTIVVTEVEKNILASLGISNVNVIPNVHEIYTGLLPEFDQRKGLLFVGGYNHLPNVDAVIWLCEEIMPLVWEKYPDMQLTLLGSNPPSQVKNLRSNRTIVTGYIHDIEPYFLNHRVFVAPLRYGAGMKGKVGQSLSYGLPVVTTSIGAEGFGLTHELDVMIADDPKYFANNILTLYNSPDLWKILSKTSSQSVERYGSKVVESQLKTLIDELLISEK
jgi:O-antigen biosynthesis protein